MLQANFAHDLALSQFKIKIETGVNQSVTQVY
jgi:hypothetical protein